MRSFSPPLLSRIVAVALTGAVLGLAQPSAQGDVFVLAQGGQIEGKLLNPTQTPRKTYEVQIAGGKMALPAELVERVTRQSEAQKRYEELLPKMPPTAEGLWKMCEWCRENGLDEQRDRHLRELVQLAPDHAQARAALGQQKWQGQWVTQEDVMKQRGFVRYGGMWKLPQEIDLESREKQFELKENEWRRNVRLWRSSLGKRNSAEALAQLQQINDPLATAAVLDLLKTEKDRPVRLLLVEILGRLRTPGAVATLITLAVDDPEGRVREQCIEELDELEEPSVAAALVRMLEDPNNDRINRAAAALARLGDEKALGPLINALRTKHRSVIPPPGGTGSINPTFGSGGSGGISVGGKPQVIDRECQNEFVRQTLVVLSHGANFGFDEDAWRRWHAALRAPNDANLRRDR